MGDSILEFTETEKDLGILIMNRTLNFTEHSNFLYGRANQRFGLLERTCNFVHSIEKRRVLYLTRVRSLFEHCPIIWRPSSDTAVNRLESLQMRAIKLILKDFSVSYSFNKLLYLTHCKQLNILPIQLKFDYHDLKFLHLVVHNFSCIKLPAYLRLFDGSSRLITFTWYLILNLMVSKDFPLREALHTHSSTKHTLVGTGFHLPYEK